ncbi:hypothetical protein QRF08_09245 [Mycobacterium tuberculosis]|nr:hypothetical protein [Mycobacterium tuberculosis]WIY18969.1 hypothetical protein QRF08_09245 [Mycobacterium tuberculosis]
MVDPVADVVGEEVDPQADVAWRGLRWLAASLPAGGGSATPG